MHRRAYLALVGTGLSLASAGCLDTVQEFTSDASSGPETIDASASELQLSVDQFDEAGWEVLDDRSDEADDVGGATNITDAGGDASVRYFRYHPDDTLTLTLVGVFETVEEATTSFDGVKEESESQYSLEDVDIGDEGYAYVTDVAVVFFRAANTVAMVGRTAPRHGDPDLDATIETAQLMYENWPN
jgi:hypothetical protein